MSKGGTLIIREVGKVLRGGQKVSGCIDRKGEVTSGEQRAGKVDKGEKGETERRPM